MTTQHFDSSIVKRDKDGNTVLSSFLEDGEEIISGGQYKTPSEQNEKQIAADTDQGTDEPHTPLEAPVPKPGVEEAKAPASGDALPEGYGGLESVATEEDKKDAESVKSAEEEQAEIEAAREADEKAAQAKLDADAKAAKDAQEKSDADEKKANDEKAAQDKLAADEKAAADTASAKTDDAEPAKPATRRSSKAAAADDDKK